MFVPLIDSRDSKWDWLFEGCLKLPEGCHIEVDSNMSGYHFKLISEGDVIQSSIMYAGNFYSAGAMARSAVKGLVHRTETSTAHRVRWDANAEAIRMELGFEGDGAIHMEWK